MSTRRYLIAALAILMLGGALRMVWLRADPPIGAPGIVWHDEGAWTHNARNKALWGQWTTDKWNPLYVAPVFTALEYGAFRAFGVGLWQARTVPVASGLLAIAMLMAGLSVLTGRRAALVGGALLATNYAWVMWNRAALMESTMIAFLVVAWAAYAMGSRRAAWGFVAGVATVLAWFTKASAAFFVAAIVADAVATLALAYLPGLRTRLWVTTPPKKDVRTALLTLAGAALAGGVIGVVFVWPHATDYWFYNVQMSVERKPSYALMDFKNRASWLPIASDFFSRMRLELVGAGIAMVGILARWREAKPAERLLALWVGLGLLELTVHNSGNERYYMMLTPALIALAATLAGSGAPWLPARLASASIKWKVLILPLVLVLGYLVAGTIVRNAFPDELAENVYRSTVRISAGLSVLVALMLVVWWRRAVTWMADIRISPAAAAALVAATALWNLGLYGQWAANRGELNYQASVALGQVLPAGTLVQGKLANGMALDNQIRPIFIGNGFGNYDDRFERDDVRYILTYDLPEIGFESQRRSGLIPEILARYPNRQTIATFTVDETAGADRAVLIDKHPGSALPAVQEFLVREISDEQIKAHADRRFRSEYDYALFEYYRSAKVIAFLERAGIAIHGRVLDAGCGGGGMPLSLAEHADEVVGIDPIDRFGQAGVLLARERGLTQLHFARADGMALPFASGAFDLVLSHAVIEHVADASLYLRECRRVLKKDGRLFLSTAPYLSFAGAHLPRLKVPVPLHLLLGRPIAFRTFRWLARHAPGVLKEPAHENSFIRDARNGIAKHDDLLELVTVRSLREQIAGAGLAIVREELHVTSTVKRMPKAVGRWLGNSALTQNALISNMEYVLAPA